MRLRCHYPRLRFPESLTSHSYFINEQDEVRNIQNPRFYFKYFISKNERWNERQRFAMNSPRRPAPPSEAPTS